MKRIAECLLVVILLALFAFGQGTTSRIAGLITDKSGAVVAGATVTATNEGTNTSYTATTSSTGTYVFDSLQIGTYTVTVEGKGFKKSVSTGNVLSIGLPLAVNAALEVGSTSETVEVKGGYDLIQTETSGNFGNVVDNATLTQLPIVGLRGRNPLNLVVIIPGVVEGGSNQTGGGMYVHGSRDRSWNYTLDGVDTNETSAGGSQLSPTRVNPDSLSEFRVITGGFTAEYGRNSGAQVTMVTKSGSNNLHGNGFWFYQSPFLNANDPGNKASQIARGVPNKPSQFVQNIYGGSVGGPVIKNKTFFFANVQLLHALNSILLTRTVYTDTLKKSGLFRYVVSPGRNGAFGSSTPAVDANGNPLPGLNIQSYNLVANDPSKIGLDPLVTKFLGSAPSPNNFTVGDGLNTAGFTFVAPQTEKQVDVTFKIDHNFSNNNSVFVRWASGHQNTVGDGANSGSPAFPGLPNRVNTFRSPRNLAIGWRVNPSNNTTNELVLGMNRFGFIFDSPGLGSSAPPFVMNLVTNPFLTAGGNTRVLTTYQLVDNYTLAHQAHTFRWGVNFRYARHIDHRYGIGSLNAAPQVTFDTGTNPVNLTTFNIPSNINTSADQGRLLSSINDLLGRIGQIQDGYVAQDQNTFKPAGSFNLIDARWPEYDFYGQDTWKIRPNFTVDYGLRLEARLAPHLTNFDNLVPNQPVVNGAPASDTLKFVPGHFYKNRWNNFAPSIGFAWDPFKDGKTSVRANYRLAYDRINTFSFSSSVFQGMPGLTTQVIDTTSGQSGLRAQNWHPAALPAGATPASLEALPSFSANSLVVADPNMRTPKTNMWGLSIQRQVAKNTVVSLTYNGRHGTALYGAYNANQVDYTSNGFLSAFNTVQPCINPANNAVAFTAACDSPLMDQIFSKDSRRPAAQTGSEFALRNFTSSFTQNSVAGLALAISQRLQGGTPLLVLDGLSPTLFQRFPQLLGGLTVLNTNDYSIYHGLEAQIERRFSNGLLYQASWTWSKSEDIRSFDPTFTLAGINGAASQSSASTPWNNSNPHLNWAPSEFDRTQVFQMNWVYDLPFGRGHHWGGSWNRAVDELLGGWEVAGNSIYETGRPITFYAGASTFSSDVQTPASCSGKCDPYMGKVYFDATKVQQYYLNYTAFNPATRCIAFSNGATSLCIPGPGQFSNIGRNFFRQPINATVNATIAKTFAITERQHLQARLEMQNVTNSQMFDTFGSQNIQSGAFARLNQTSDGVMQNNPRRMQLSLKYTF